jgi:hypothetical protein
MSTPEIQVELKAMQSVFAMAIAALLVNNNHATLVSHMRQIVREGVHDNPPADKLAQLKGVHAQAILDALLPPGS